MASILSKNLLYLRKEKTLSQEKLATVIGVKRSTVQNYEDGTTEPVASTIKSICQYFGVTYEEFLDMDLESNNVHPTVNPNVHLLEDDLFKTPTKKEDIDWLKVMGSIKNAIVSLSGQLSNLESRLEAQESINKPKQKETV